MWKDRTEARTNTTAGKILVGRPVRAPVRLDRPLGEAPPPPAPPRTAEGFRRPESLEITGPDVDPLVVLEPRFLIGARG